MDLDDARSFVRGHHRAILTTLRDDGSPQMSPVGVAVDDHGHLVVSTREGALKTRNLRKRPRAWLCVISDDFYGRWVQVEGRGSRTEPYCSEKWTASPDLRVKVARAVPSDSCMSIGVDRTNRRSSQAASA